MVSAAVGWYMEGKQRNRHATSSHLLDSGLAYLKNEVFCYSFTIIGPTKNTDKESAPFVNSVRNAFNQAQAKNSTSSEVLDEAKRIYSHVW